MDFEEVYREDVELVLETIDLAPVYARTDLLMKDIYRSMKLQGLKYRPGTMADEVQSRKRLARLIMDQALRSWMTSVNENMSASDTSAVEGWGQPPDSRPNIEEGTRNLGARSTQCRAQMKVAGTPTRENDPVKAVFAGQPEPGSSSKTASTRTFDSSQTPSKYATLAAYMTKATDSKSIVARPGSLNDATMGSIRLRDPLKTIFGKNSMLLAASTGAKQKELLTASVVAAGTPSKSSSSKGGGKKANTKSGHLSIHADRGSVHRELIELDSNENENNSVLLTTTGRPARKKS